MHTRPKGSGGCVFTPMCEKRVKIHNSNPKTKMKNHHDGNSKDNEEMKNNKVIFSMMNSSNIYWYQFFVQEIDINHKRDLVWNAYPKLSINELVSFYRHLLVGLNMVVQSGFYGCFINPSTVYIIQKDPKIVIPDDPDENLFKGIHAILMVVEKAKTKSQSSSLSFRHHLDLHILAYLDENNLDSISLYSLDEIIEGVINSSPWGSVVDCDKVLQRYKRYINVDRKLIEKEMFESRWRTWDLHGLNLLFLEVLQEKSVHENVKSKGQTVNNFTKLWSKFLLNTWFSVSATPLIQLQQFDELCNLLP